MSVPKNTSRKGRWRLDKEVTCCQLCTSVFTFLRRKHHCRECGDIFCDDCTSFKMLIPSLHPTKKLRVCKTCYNTVVERRHSVGRLSNLSCSSGAPTTTSTHKPTAEKLTKLSKLNEQNAKEDQQQQQGGAAYRQKKGSSDLQRQPGDGRRASGKLPTSATLTEGGTTATTQRSAGSLPVSNNRLEQQQHQRSQKQPHNGGAQQQQTSVRSSNKQIYSSIASTGELMGSHNPSRTRANTTEEQGVNDSYVTPIESLLPNSNPGGHANGNPTLPRYNASVTASAPSPYQSTATQGYYGEGSNTPHQSASTSMHPTYAPPYLSSGGTPPYVGPLHGSIAGPATLVAVVTNAAAPAPSTDPYSLRYHGADVEDNDRIPDYKVFHDSERDVSMRGPSARSQAIYFHQQQQQQKSRTAGSNSHNDEVPQMGVGSAAGPSSLLLRQATSSFTGPNPNSSFLKPGSRPSNLNVNPSSFCNTSYTATPHSVACYSGSVGPFAGGPLPSPLMEARQYGVEGKQTSALSNTDQYPYHHDTDTPTKRREGYLQGNFSSNNNTSAHLLGAHDDNSGRHSTSTAAPPPFGTSGLGSNPETGVMFSDYSHDSAMRHQLLLEEREGRPPMTREATIADIPEDDSEFPSNMPGASQEVFITSSATPASPVASEVNHQATHSNNLKNPNNYFLLSNASFAHKSDQGATNTGTHSQQASSYCFNTNRSENNRSRPTWMDSNTTNNNGSVSNMGNPPSHGEQGSIRGSISQTTSPVATGSARRSSRIAISAQRSDDYYYDEYDEEGEEEGEEVEEHHQRRYHKRNNTRNGSRQQGSRQQRDGEAVGNSEEYFEGTDDGEEDDEGCYYNDYDGANGGDYRSFGQQGDDGGAGVYDDDSDGESLLNGPIPSQEVLMGIMAQQAGNNANSGAAGRVSSMGVSPSSGRPISPSHLAGQGLPSQYLVPSHLRGPSVASNGVVIIPSYDQQVLPSHARSFSGQHFSSHATSMAASKNASFNGVYAAQHYNYQHQLQLQLQQQSATSSPPVSLRFLNSLQEGVVGGANSNDVLTLLMYPGPGKEQSMIVTVSENETLGDLVARLADNYVKLDQNPFARPTPAQLAELKSKLRFLTDRHELHPSLVAKDLIAQNQRRIVLSALPTHMVLPNVSPPSDSALADSSNGDDLLESEAAQSSVSLQGLPSSGRLIPSSRTIGDDGRYHREESSSVRFHTGHHQPLTVSQQSIRDFLQGSECSPCDDPNADIGEDIEY